MRRLAVLALAGVMMVPAPAAAQSPEVATSRVLCITVTGAPDAVTPGSLLAGLLNGSISLDAVGDCPPSPTETPQPVGVTGAWIVGEIERDPLTDEPTAAAGLFAEDENGVGLVIRCRPGKETEAFINWGEYLGSDPPRVTTRLDDDEPKERTWNASTDSRSTFYPLDPIEFIESLFGRRRLVAQTTPFNEAPKTVVFTLAGVEEAVANVREACGW